MNNVSSLLERALPFEPLLIGSLAASVMADPVLATFGLAETVLCLLLLATAVSAILGALHRGVDLDAKILRHHLPLLLFLATFLLSMIVGIISGASPRAVLRATLSYLLLALVVPVVLTRGRKLNASMLMFGVAATGAAQAVYLIGLYLLVNDRFDSVMELMIHRTTLVDPRTTVPVFIGAAAIPAALASPCRAARAVFGASLLTGLMVTAGFTTLTRSQVVTIILEFVALCSIAFIVVLVRRGQVRMRALRVIATSVIAMISVHLLFIFSPQFRLLPAAIFVRNAIEMEAPATPVNFTILKEVLERNLSNPTVHFILNGESRAQNGPKVVEVLKRLADRVGIDRAHALVDEYALAAAELERRNAPIGKERKQGTLTVPPNVVVDPEHDAAARPKDSEKIKPPTNERQVDSSNVTATAPKVAPSIELPVINQKPALGEAAGRAEEISGQLGITLTKAIVETNNGGKLTVGSGRLEDEIVPALTLFTRVPWYNKILGIGAGNVFVTSSGEPRTYIHNFPLYILLFNGILGVGALIAFFTALCWRALVRWWDDGDAIALAALTVMVSLNIYALLFAIHKLIAFNLMLAAAYLAIFASRSSGGRIQMGGPELNRGR